MSNGPYFSICSRFYKTSLCVGDTCAVWKLELPATTQGKNPLVSVHLPFWRVTSIPAERKDKLEVSASSLVQTLKDFSLKSSLQFVLCPFTHLLPLRPWLDATNYYTPPVPVPCQLTPDWIDGHFTKFSLWLGRGANTKIKDQVKREGSVTSMNTWHSSPCI